MKITSIRTSSEVAKVRARRSARRRSSTLPPAIAARLSLGFVFPEVRDQETALDLSEFSITFFDMGAAIGTFQTA